MEIPLVLQVFNHKQNGLGGLLSDGGQIFESVTNKISHSLSVENTN